MLSDIVNQAFQQARGVLTEGLGADVEYGYSVGEKRGTTKIVRAIVNRTTAIADPNGGGGVDVVETRVTAQVPASEVGKPYAHKDKGDTILEADGSHWRIVALMPEHPNRFGLYRCILAPKSETGF